MPRRAFSIQRKLDAVALARKTSRSNAARVFKVDPKRIREWCKCEEKFIRTPKRAKRLEGGGRHVMHDAMEDELVRWITTQRAKSLRVSRKMIQSDARRIIQEEEDSCTTFIASDGWLRKFLKRNRFSLRKRTTVAQKTPEHVKESHRFLDFYA